MLATFLILLLSGVMVCIYALLKIKEPKANPIFSQERFGLNYKRIKVYKFRSMVSNASELLEKDKELFKKYVANDYKLDPDEDPRMTSLGRFLRSTSLDELPQLFNVLNGSMTFVGPRPIVDKELYTEYTELEIQYLLSVKPGISGYWQVNGRSNVKYPERKRMELYYVQNKSIKLDFQIMFKTIFSVLKKDGAY
ncbi:sugar transferase [Exiguobacterium sp. SH0S2]|nr:sugar transferase [Exiguobacterium sp. SH0S2]